MVLIKNEKENFIAEATIYISVACWKRGMLEAGGGILDAGCWRLDTGCWILDDGCWMLDTG